MAIRFESTCDDKVKWHARALYSEHGRNENTTSASSPLNLSYGNELSDHDERRTNSCSPNSSDERSPLAAAPAGSAHVLHFASNNGGDVTVEGCSFAPSWQVQGATFDGGVNRRSVVGLKRSEGELSGAEKRVWNENNALPSPNLFVRSQASRESFFSRANQANSDVTEVARSRDVCGSKQNGGASGSSSTVEKLNREFIVFRDTKDSDSNDKERGASSAVNDSLLVDVENNSEASMLLGSVEGFGETDAAEALLGLSEGFYHNTKSPSSSTLPRKLKMDLLSKLTDSGGNKAKSQLDLTRGTSPNSISVQGAGSADIGSGPRGSKFHYKKRIFQKYVNSQAEPSLPHLVQPEALISSDNTNPNGNQNCGHFQADFSAAIRNEQIAFSEGPIATDTQAANLSSFQSSALQSNPGFKANDLIKAKTNSKTAKSFRSELNHHDDNAIKAINPDALQPSVAKSKSICRRSSRESAVERERNNLYRISTSLGSSNESLSANAEETNEDLAFDSATSASSSSESDEEDDDNPSPNNSLSSIKNAKLTSAEETKRRVVLNKPKFSLPAWSNISERTNVEVDDRFQSSDKGFMKNAAKQSDFKLLSGSSLSSKRAQSPFANVATSMNEVIKQTEIHIKKATFTFNRPSSQKAEHAAQQNGLSLTSHADTLSDGACQIAKDKNSFRFQDKSKSSEAAMPTCADSLADKNLTFGGFRNGDSFETLSKPGVHEKAGTSKSKKSQRTSTFKHESSSITDVPYDKDRLPRPSARSAALEAQQSFSERKRKLSSLQNNAKQKSKQLGKPLIKRLKHEVEDKKCKSRLTAKTTPVALSTSSHKKPNEPKQNGDSVVETSSMSSKSNTERSSSRRKPSRVFKHQKYTSVSMMSSNHSPRDSSTPSEFAIISKPLNLDHRVLLANSIDLCHGSPNSADLSASTSSSMTSSTSSSRTSSVAGDDNEAETSKKSESSSTERNRCKRHRHLSAIETNLKSELLKQKHKMKRMLSVADSVSRGCSNGLVGSSLLSSNWRRGPPHSGRSPTFQLLALFPAPASIKAGFAPGELLPGYGPSVSGRRSSLPLRWSKGRDVRDLKQKRQREKLRKMTFDMFCMGAAL